MGSLWISELRHRDDTSRFPQRRGRVLAMSMVCTHLRLRAVDAALGNGVHHLRQGLARMQHLALWITILSSNGSDSLAAMER